jgi:hypothetical protein
LWVLHWWIIDSVGILGDAAIILVVLDLQNIWRCIAVLLLILSPRHKVQFVHQYCLGIRDIGSQLAENHRASNHPKLFFDETGPLQGED